MPTAIDLIRERQALADQITDLLNACVDEDGLLDINADKLIELQELQLTNEADIIDKAEAIVFAVRKLESQLETYAETIRNYQTLKHQTQNNIDYLTESLLPAIIKALGTDNKLPTPTFPRLRVRTFGRGKVIINDNYNAPIDPSLYRPHRPTLKDVDKELLAEMIEAGTIPVDDDGNPLAIKTEPVIKATFR